MNRIPMFEDEAKELFDPTAMVNISDVKPPTVEQLLMHLIEVQIELTNSIQDLTESNHALIEAMAGVDDEDEDPMSRYQTLGGEEP